jgi:hypothetical protein
VRAIPEYTKVLPVELKNFCNVCHVKNSGGPLNPFGEDYVSIDFDRLMELDSDSDGYSNGDELDAGKLPGNATSHPGRENQKTFLLIGGLALLISGIILLYIKFIK